eukprot:g14177.t1
MEYVTLILLILTTFVGAEAKQSLSKTKHFARMEALTMILDDTRHSSIHLVSSAIHKLEQSVRKEQDEEAKEARMLCTDDYKANISVDNEYGSISGCYASSNCSIEANEFVEKLSAHQRDINHIDSETPGMKEKLQEKKKKYLRLQSELNKQMERLESYKQENEEHISNHNDARDALGNIRLLLLRSRRLFASNEDKLAISREPIAAPIMRFLEKPPNSTNLKDALINDIVEVIDKLVRSLDKASAGQKERFDLHVSLLEDMSSELKDELRQISSDINTTTTIMDKMNIRMQKLTLQKEQEKNLMEKRMHFCKRSYDIYKESSNDRAEEIKLVLQIEKIVKTHFMHKGNLHKKKLRGNKATRMQQYDMGAQKTAIVVAEASQKADALQLEKDREEAKKVNQTISEQNRKEEQEKATIRKRNGALIDKYISLEKREIESPGKESEELKKQITRQAQIVKHSNGLLDEEKKKSNSEQYIKDMASRALQNVASNISPNQAGQHGQAFRQSKPKVVVSSSSEVNAPEKHNISFTVRSMAKQNGVRVNNLTVNAVDDLHAAKNLADRMVKESSKRHQAEIVTSELNGNAIGGGTMKTRTAKNLTLSYQTQRKILGDLAAANKAPSGEKRSR